MDVLNLVKYMQQNSKETPTEAIVDADFLVYRIAFANEGAPEKAAKNRLTEWLDDMIYLKLKCTDYRAWLTGKSNFRYSLAVTQPYKGNRKDFVRPEHYLALREHLQTRHGAVMSVDEEADDSVATASMQGNYWIVHVDKDLDQLEGWHYNPVKDEQYYVSEFEGLRNFYTQMLTGDRTDNIPGIDGIGPKKAEKALKDCTNELELYEAVWKMYQNHNLSHERLVEVGRLLWLRRSENQMWLPPSASVGVSGESSTQKD